MFEEKNVKEVFVDMDNPNKMVRKKGLGKLKQHLVQSSLNDCLILFNDSYKVLVTSLSDPSEGCREISCQILTFFSNALESTSFSPCLPYLFPSIRQRLPQEAGEEVRLEMLTLVDSVASRQTTESLAPFLKHIVDTLCLGLQDKNPDLLVLTCSASTRLAELHPSLAKLQFSSLTCYLLPLTSHHLMKVRVAAIGCLGQVLSLVGARNVDIEEIVGCLKPRIFDQSSRVRLEVCKTVFYGLRTFKEEAEVTEQLLPLGLALLEDDMEEVGDVTSNSVDHSENSEISLKVMVRKHKNKLFEIINISIEDWRKDIRLLGGRALCCLLRYIEPDDLENNLELVIQCLVTQVTDSEKECNEVAIKSALKLGSCVPFDKGIEELLSLMGDDPTVGHLIVLSNILSGFPDDKVSMDVMEFLSHYLAQENICHNCDEKFQTLLLQCLSEILKKCDSRIDSSPLENISHHLFIALHSVRGLSYNDNIGDLAKDSLERLPDILSSNKESVYRREVGRLVTSLRQTPTTLSKVKVLKSVLLEAGHGGIEPVSQQVMEFLKIMLAGSHSNQPTRLAVWNTLENLLQNKCLRFSYHEQVVEIVRDILLPSTVWRPGLSEQDVRFTAASCLYLLMSMDKVYISLLREMVRGRLLSLLEDQDDRTRRVSCQLICLLIEQEEDNVIKDRLIQGLMSRLDDSVGSVRKEAAFGIRVLTKKGKTLEGKEVIDEEFSDIVKDMLVI
jgi:hypothetical protein